MRVVGRVGKASVEGFVVALGEDGGMRTVRAANCERGERGGEDGEEEEEEEEGTQEASADGHPGWERDVES